MKLSLIAALTPTRVIGKNNQLPWHLPADLQYFRKVTLHKPVIMGRKTFESIGKALPKRKNIVITRQASYEAKGCEIAHSLTEALEYLSLEEEIFIIGGSEIFIEALPLANYLYLTFVKANITGDIYFPEWNQNQWNEISRENHQKDKENNYDYSFVILERI
jgi:dihydrofolate reductase